MEALGKNCSGKREILSFKGFAQQSRLHPDEDTVVIGVRFAKFWAISELGCRQKTLPDSSWRIVEAHIEARSTWGSIAKLGGQIAQVIEVLSLALIT